MISGVIMGDYGRGRVYRRGTVWWIDYYVSGRRKRERTDAENKTEARDILNQRLVDVRARPVASKEPTFADAEAALKNDYARKGNRSDPEKRLRHLRPTFAGLDLHDITTARVHAYAGYRVKHEGAAPATVNRELACLRRMFNVMRELGQVQAVPHFPMHAENNVRTGFVTEDELQAVLGHLRPAVRPVVEFAYVTGWRKSECLSRDWQHVTERSVRLEPGETKNEDGREFPMIPRLAAVIEYQRQRMKGRIGGPLFFWSPGRRIKSFKESWQSAVDRAGMPGLLFHDLRRSAVRNLVLAGIDEHTAMKLTGHRTRAVFERYDIIDSARLHEQASKLEAFYADQETTVRAIR